MKVSIDANIGAGKTTLLTKLCQELRVPVFLEPVQEWQEWLKLFYEDPERWGMSFNMKVLLSFSKWRDNNFFALYERSPLSNRYVFSELQKQDGKMTSLELKLFENIYEQISWVPDVLIYIKTDPEVCMNRMKTRGRSCETGVSLEYLKSINDKYETICCQSSFVNTDYTNGKQCRVYVVDGNRSAEEVYESVKNLVYQLYNKT